MKQRRADTAKILKKESCNILYNIDNKVLLVQNEHFMHTMSTKKGLICLLIPEMLMCVMHTVEIVLELSKNSRPRGFQCHTCLLIWSTKLFTTSWYHIRSQSHQRRQMKQSVVYKKLTLFLTSSISVAKKHLIHR